MGARDLGRVLPGYRGRVQPPREPPGSGSISKAGRR